MVKHIMLCPKCKTYTMSEVCKKCNSETIHSWPPKFSPDDPHGEYRRKAKADSLKEKGFI